MKGLLIKSEKGFTLIEIVIVIMVFAIIAGLSLTYFQSSQLSADLNKESTILVSNMRLVQGNAVSGNTIEPTSIHFDDISYTLFLGDTYNPLTITNELIELPSTVSLSGIALSGGENDLIFEGPAGETSTYGTLNIVSSALNKTIPINITEIGTINY